MGAWEEAQLPAPWLASRKANSPLSRPVDTWGPQTLQVGSDLTPVEVAELTGYAAANRQAVFVTLDWLRRCGARREKLPADDRFLIHVSSLQGAKRKVWGRLVGRKVACGSWRFVAGAAAVGPDADWSCQDRCGVCF